MKKLKIALIGCGNIAQKAYLPVLAAMQDRIEIVVSSRTVEQAEKLRNQYNFALAYEGIVGLPDIVDAVFIHTPTDTHYEMCRYFLQHNVHVFVDKPLSENIQEVRSLRELANEKEVLLMVGFNRRFAPFVEELKQITGKNLLLLTKNRKNEPAPTLYTLFDLFIHPLDTAIFLLDEKVEKASTKLIHNDTGDLIRAMVRMETKNATALVTMNLQSGANTETMEIQSLSGTATLENLTTLKIQNEDGTSVKEFSDWTQTLEKRGFLPMIHAFIAAVEKREQKELPIEECMKELKQEKTDFTHKFISEIEIKK